jgi:O-antigen/teichoic acid export membrane protein
MFKKVYYLLKSSERYFKTDMMYLAKGGFWLSVGYGISTLSGLVLTIVLGNLLPQDVYGQYKFVISTIGVIGAFTLTGLGPSTIRSVAKGFEGTFKIATKTFLKWGVLTFLISLGVAIYYFINDNNILAICMLILGSLWPPLVSMSLYNPFLVGKKEFKTKTFYGIFQNTIPALSIIITVLLTESVVLIILIYFLSSVITTILLYFQTLRKYKPNNLVDPDGLTYGKHLSLMDILGILSLYLDKILVFHYLGAVQLAIYAFALAMPRQIQSLNKILKSLIFPKISNRKVEELKKSIPEKATKVFVVAVAIVAIYIFISPYIYKYIFPQYIDSILYSQVFSLSLLFFPGMLFNQTLIAHMRKKELYFLKTFTPTLRILLFLVLLPLYGIWGAIFSILVTDLIKFILQIVLFKRIKST